MEKIAKIMITSNWRKLAKMMHKEKVREVRGCIYERQNGYKEAS